MTPEQRAVLNVEGVDPAVVTADIRDIAGYGRGVPDRAIGRESPAETARGSVETADLVVGGRSAEDGVVDDNRNEGMIVGDTGGEMFQALPVTAAGGWAPSGPRWGKLVGPGGVEREGERGIAEAGSASVGSVGGPVGRGGTGEEKGDAEEGREMA